MFNCNLTSPGTPIKLPVFNLGRIAQVCVIFASLRCSDDPTTVIDETFDYSGTYVATYATEMVDGEQEYNYGGNSITGLLVIQDTVYTLSVAFDYGSGYFGRNDYGKLIIYDGYVDFSPVADTVLQSTARGFYDAATERIKISYIRDNILWTEYWKAAKPVTDYDSTRYLPY